MGKKTYSRNRPGTANSPGVQQVVQAAPDPTIEIWGHSIDMTDGDTIICTDCGMEESLPRIFKQTTGFRQVVYRLYLLGRFKHEQCGDDTLEDELETDTMKLLRKKYSQFDNHNPWIHPDKSKIHWSDTKRNK